MNMNCGFNTDLANGLTVSVQWHDGAMSHRRDDDDTLQSVEIACWKTGSMDDAKDSGAILWLTRDVWAEGYPHDDVIGHVSVDRVMDFMDRAAQLPTDYVSLLAELRATANMKREAEEVKQEAEDWKRESAMMTAEMDRIIALKQETADIKQKTEEMKQEIEDLKQEKDNLERERAESYDGII